MALSSKPISGPCRRESVPGHDPDCPSLEANSNRVAATAVKTQRPRKVPPAAAWWEICRGMPRTDGGTFTSRK